MTQTASQSEPAIQLEPETPFDRARVEALVDQAFGPGRYAKTAERLREGSRPLAELSFVARVDGQIAGSVRLWPLTIAGEPAAFLGPIAVDAAGRSRGVGAALVERACEAARASGLRIVLLVGAEAYFGRFGFVPAKVRLPGPSDPRRVLARVFEGAPPEGLARAD